MLINRTFVLPLHQPLIRYLRSEAICSHASHPRIAFYNIAATLASYGVPATAFSPSINFYAITERNASCHLIAQIRSN